MRILVFHGADDWQSRKICAFLAGKITDDGHEALLVHGLNDENSDPLETADAVLIAGMAGGEGYPRDVADFIAAHHEVLGGKPNAFLSVSLTLPGTAGLEKHAIETGLADFTSAAGWTPDGILHVDGTLRFADYGFWRGLGLRVMAWWQDRSVNPFADVVYTDRAMLARFLKLFLARVARS